MAHKVKAHHWIDGILNFIEREFETLDEARFFAETAEHHNAKVFDDSGVVVHYVVKSPADINVSSSTYA